MLIPPGTRGKGRQPVKGSTYRYQSNDRHSSRTARRNFQAAQCAAVQHRSVARHVPSWDQACLPCEHALPCTPHMDRRRVAPRKNKRSRARRATLSLTFFAFCRQSLMPVVSSLITCSVMHVAGSRQINRVGANYSELRRTHPTLCDEPCYTFDCYGAP